MAKEYVRYFKTYLNELESPENTLFKGMKHLKGHTWWVSAGTALGLHREGDFIAKDTDIDVGVRAQEGQQHIEIPDMTLIRTDERKGRIIQTAYLDDNNCIFDIYYYYSDIKPGYLICYGELGTIKKPDFEIKELDTKYGKLPFMTPIEDYLEDRYGEDWRIPSSKGYRYVREI